MEPKPERNINSDNGSSQQFIPQLIMKLRWIGLNKEAEQLEAVALELPAEQRCSVSFGPFSTD